ncbi:hypothetical protein [Microvirga sp. VF16]|uniref:hypothetical protein n=1 Tax=Microvirga sp. VF16 TaxID=2807101 RepID=UPI00193E6CF2|nr:hypothetical protein [Microvirga sp. VF16]QRM34421.1 hypothetical protein JO965_35085 [Microvirga sp. VF16]
MIAPLIRKLENFTKLSEEEKAALAQVARRTTTRSPTFKSDTPGPTALITAGSRDDENTTSHAQKDGA